MHFSNPFTLCCGLSYLQSQGYNGRSGMRFTIQVKLTSPIASRNENNESDGLHQKRGLFPNRGILAIPHKHDFHRHMHRLPYIARYNRTVRGEWLGQYIFETIEEAQDQATEWLSTYNNERPNMGIGGITLAMKLKTAA